MEGEARRLHNKVLMTKFNKGPRHFSDDEYPLNIHHLKVVALVQDDDSREILQAVQVDAPVRGK